MAAVRPARKRSLPDEIIDQILRLVASGGLPDNRLPSERDLASDLVVSRTSLREALAALTQLGVVEMRGKRKYVDAIRAQAQLAARTPSNERERELLSEPSETRRLLEPEVAARAAERASESDLASIAKWLDLMTEAAQRGERVAEYDSAFHVAIASATGNRMLTSLVSALADALRQSRELSFLPSRGVEVSLRGHQRILKALRARDPARARREMRKHLDDVERMIRLALETE